MAEYKSEGPIKDLEKRPEREKLLVVGAIILGLLIVLVLFLVTAGNPPDELPIENPDGTTTVDVEDDLEDELIDEDYVQAAIEDLQTRLDGTPTVDVVRVESRQWPDGCLGLSEPGQACTQTVVGGYEVVLSAEGQQYTYRTDSEGNLVILEE